MSAQTPSACADLQKNVNDLNDQIGTLEDELKDAPKQGRQKIINQINALKLQLRGAEKSLAACIVHSTFPPFGPPPQPTQPVISTDTSPVTKTKVISLGFPAEEI